MTTLDVDPFLIELTTAIPQDIPRCDCVGTMTYHSTDILCANHDNCQQDQAGGLFRVCLGCVKRYCSACFTNLHSHPILNGCHTISYLSYTNALTMYSKCGTPGAQPNSKVMSISLLMAQCPIYFKKTRSAKHCKKLLEGLLEKYGPTYTLTFLEFLRTYTENTALVFAAVDMTETRRFHSLGRWGRCWFSCYKKGGDSFNFLCFNRMLRRLQMDQGQNVWSVMSFMYHIILVNLIGSVVYGLMLFLPWMLGSKTRESAPTLTNFKWTGLTTGLGIDSLPMGFGGFPDKEWAPNDPSLGHFVVLLPIFVFLIFCIATGYSWHLVSQNRQSLSETVSSPALLGNVSTTVFTMFEHNHTDSKSHTQGAMESYHANVMMAMIKKYNPNQKATSLMKCRETRNIFVMFASWIIIMGAAISVFMIDHYGLSHKIGQRTLRLGDFQQLVFPIIFWIFRYLTEQVSIFLVQFEVPKKIHLYNRFRSVLFYRLSFLNVCFLVCLVTASYFHQKDIVPLHQSINVSTQVALGYCSAATCKCPAQTLGMFFYRILIVGFYFEFVMAILSILRTIFVRTCRSDPAFFFSPIPRLCQFYFIQALVWASVIYLPVSPVLGFLITLVGWFLTYFKIQVLKLKPEHGVYLLPSKIQFYLPFIILILLSYVPSIILLSQHPNCGPFVFASSVNLNAFGLFTDAANEFPVVVKEFFSYITNPLILWLLIIGLGTAIISYQRIATITKKERNKLLSRLALESHERIVLIKRLGVDYEDEDHRGEELFLQWMNHCMATPLLVNDSDYTVDSTKLLYTYLRRIQHKHPNFIQLSHHSDSQLKAIFQNCGCPAHIADLLVASFFTFLRQYNNTRVLRRKRVI